MIPDLFHPVGLDRGKDRECVGSRPPGRFPVSAINHVLPDFWILFHHWDQDLHLHFCKSPESDRVTLFRVQEGLLASHEHKAMLECRFTERWHEDVACFRQVLVEAN